MIAVADTSPLNYLIQIQLDGLFPRLFQKVLVPSAVWDELSHQAAPVAVRDWISSPPPWIEVCPVAGPIHDPKIDAGEAEAIALALAVGALLVIDDRKGREVATALGIPVVGTIGILDRAAREGLLDFSETIHQLAKTNFHFKEGQVEAIVASFVKG